MKEEKYIIEKLEEKKINSNIINFFNNGKLCFFELKINKNSFNYIKAIFENSNKLNIIKFINKYDVNYYIIYIEYININLLFNDLNNKVINLLDNEKKLLKEVKSFNKSYNDKSITYNDLSLLEKKEKDIIKEANKLRIKYPKKFIRYVTLNYLNKANLYLNNKDYNKSNKDKIFTTFIKNLLQTEKIKEERKKINSNYGIYDNKRYEKKDNLEDYDNFNYHSYYNLKDLKFKNLNYKL